MRSSITILSILLWTIQGLCSPSFNSSLHAIVEDLSIATEQPDSSSDLDNLYQMMTGSFNSERQSINDTDYYNISLHMYPIWKEKKGKYLYVEQSLNNDQSKPYRQRIYLLKESDDGVIESIVYKIKNEEEFIGMWEYPGYFSKYDTEILQERDGCTVYIKATTNGAYQGKTKRGTCKSTMRGASYATSKVYIHPNRIESWDRGFDGDGNLKWGAKNGPYIFDRLK